MYWRCKCGHKNPENARACNKCKSSESAKKTFYAGAVASAAIVFFLVYVAGIYVGGTVIIFSIEPTEAQILAQAKSMGMKTEYKEELKTIHDLKPKQKDEAEAKAVEKAKGAMSGGVRNILFWTIPFLMFPLFGVIFGFSTAGRTIIEVSIGSIVGQAVGFAFLKFANGVPLSYLELGIGVAVGFAIVAVGEYLGESFQEKKERAVLEETRDSEVAASAWSV
jgi:hypothetical protein